jgi:hypothetical protein
MSLGADVSKRFVLMFAIVAILAPPVISGAEAGATPMTAVVPGTYTFKLTNSVGVVYYHYDVSLNGDGTGRSRAGAVSWTQPTDTTIAVVVGATTFKARITTRGFGSKRKLGTWTDSPYSGWWYAVRIGAPTFGVYILHENWDGINWQKAGTFTLFTDGTGTDSQHKYQITWSESGTEIDMTWIQSTLEIDFSGTIRPKGFNSPKSPGIVSDNLGDSGEWYAVGG